MTIQQLQYILEVQRTGSVSQAAKNLFVSQSGISTCLASLESELGYSIFERTRYGMVATAQGVRVLEHAGKICASYRDMMHERIIEKTRIRIGCGSYAPFSNAFVKLILENREREDLQFSMLTGCGVDTIISKVASAELELGILMTHTPVADSRAQQIKRKGLQVQMWKPVPAVITVSSKHRLYSKENIALQDFADEALVDIPAAAVVNNRLLRSLLPINREKAILVSSRQVRTELVRQGVVYTIGPLSPSKYRDPDFRYVPLGDVTYTPIFITDPARAQCPQITRYLELLRQEMDI